MIGQRFLGSLGIAVIASIHGATSAATVALSDLFAGSPSEVNLSNADDYVGGVEINFSTTINGNGATIDLDEIQGGLPEIKVIGGATVTINNVTIRDGSVAGISAADSSTVTVNNSSIIGAARALLIDSGSTITTSNCTMTTGYIGVDVLSGGTAIIDGSNLNSASTHGIFVQSGTLTVRNGSTIGGVGTSGITGNNSSISVSDTTINGDYGYGVFMSGGGTFTGTNLDIVNSTSYGLSLDQVTASLSNVRVTSGASFNAPTFPPATFTPDSKGIQLGGCPSINLGNLTIAGQAEALNIYSPGSPVTNTGMTIVSSRRGIAAIAAQLTLSNQDIEVTNSGIHLTNNCQLNLGASEVAVGSGGFAALDIADSSASVQSSTIRGTNAQSIISVRNTPLTLNNVDVTGTATYGVNVNGSSVNATDLDLGGTMQFGLIADGIPVTLNSVSFERGTATPSGTAISILNSPDVSITGFTGSGLNLGVQVVDPTGDVDVADLVFTDMKEGLAVTRASQEVSIDGVYARRVVPLAIYIDDCTTDIRNVDAQDCTDRVIFIGNGSVASLRDSAFINNALAVPAKVIQVTNSTATLEGNVRFENTSVTPAFGQPDVGYGLSVENSTVVVRPGNTFITQQLGIHSYDGSDVTVRGCHFERNGEAFYLDNAALTVEDCYIENNTVGQSLQADGTVDLIYRRNINIQSYESGVGIDAAGTVLIEDNYFQDLRFGGISISPTGASPTSQVRRNTIRRPGDPGAMYTRGDGAVYKLNAALDPQFMGIADTGSNGTFERNFFLGVAQKCANLGHTEANHIRANYFQSCNDGVLQSSGQLYLDGNQFADLGDGAGQDFPVFVTSTGHLVRAAYNNLTSTTQSGLWAADTPLADAEYNWWGSASGPNEDGYLGPGVGVTVTNADFDPFLTRPAVLSSYIDDLNIAPGQSSSPVLMGDLSGVAFDYTTPQAINQAAAAVWASLQNQTTVPAGGMLAGASPLVYLTAINDARLTIYGGQVTLVLSQGFFNEYALDPTTMKGMWLNEETQTWSELSMVRSAETVRITMPTHSLSMVISDDADVPDLAPRFGGISTRGWVGRDASVMIGGIIVDGQTPKRVVARGIGPAMSEDGVPNTLSDPRIDIYSGTQLILSNDNWQDGASAAELTGTTFAPENPLEAALVADLDPGAYTVILSGTGGAIGNGLVEIYEWGHVDPSVSVFRGISTRGFVGTNDDVMIAGFIVEGNEEQDIIVRGLGPTMQDAGLTDLLANPSINVFSGQTLILSNDDWRTAPRSSEVEGSDFEPAYDVEAAILNSFAPGVYTAILSGVGGASGNGLIEVYRWDR